MVLAIDIGNTNIKYGLFSDGLLVQSWKTSCDESRTSDEMGLEAVSFLAYNKRSTEDIEGIIVSSVRPSINYTIEHMCQVYFGATPIFVGPGIKTGINLRYDNPRELGADRICTAVAAYKQYGGPCITVDFGTATTYGVISAAGDFLGGVICPGIKIAAQALVEQTAKLPKIELVKPDKVIGKNTVNCIQSGIIHGFVGQIDYILDKLLAELDLKDVKVVATGGMSNIVLGESKHITRINSTLALEGLYLIFQMNK